VYNSTGHLTNTIYPSGANISHLPNALGQARQAGTYATNALFHANGMVKSHSYGNTFAHVSTQNNSGLPLAFSDIRSGVSALNHGFTYDANNNVTFLNDKFNTAYNINMTFDGLDRLDIISNSFSGAGDVDYDTMGNITYYKVGSEIINYVYNASKQLTSTNGSKSYAFGYDAKGNVNNNGTRTFTYNTANQMVQSGGYLYTYDGNNKRVKEQGSSSTPSYSFYGSNGKLMYRNVNGQHHDYYYLGGKLVANKKGTLVTYLHSDYLGSTAAVSTIAGVVTERLHYQPFGKSIEAPKDDIGYTGHKFDTDLGLSYMQARYYDPVIGRFYSNDPVGFNNVHNFNRYAYANNNPYKYTDPDGNNAIRILARLVKNPVMTYRSAKRFLRENGVLAPLPPRVDPNPGSDVPVGDPVESTGVSGESGKNKGKKGTGFRGGKKKDRDNTKGNQNGDFGDQIHGEKLPGDSDFTPEEIEKELEEFEKRDKPGRRERERQRREDRERKRKYE